LEGSNGPPSKLVLVRWMEVRDVPPVMLVLLQWMEVNNVAPVMRVLQRWMEGSNGPPLVLVLLRGKDSLCFSRPDSGLRVSPVISQVPTFQSAPQRTQPRRRNSHRPN
jgi:hypothetical protein